MFMSLKITNQMEAKINDIFLRKYNYIYWSQKWISKTISDKSDIVCKSL